MTTERNIYRILLAGAIVYILFLQMCGTKPACPDQQVATVQVDTGFIVEHSQIPWEKPKPDTIILPGKQVLWQGDLYNQDTVFFVELVDTAAILQDYFAKVYYQDSMRTQYGTIVVEDTISQNRIQARRWATNFKIPTITKTVTVAEKSRNQIYAGFSGLFGQLDLGAEINLTLKTKKDQQYEVGAGLFGRQWYGRVGTKFKLSFK